MVEWQKPPEIAEVDEPQAGPGEIVIRVGGAGACHSDLHLMEWPPGVIPWKLPFTLGHETAGWITEIGPTRDPTGTVSAANLETGMPVLIYGPWGCGHCRNCHLGMENYCERSARGSACGGLGLDGGMAEYLRVPSSRFVVPLTSLDPAEAAPLADAALTPYHAIKRSLELLVPGSAAVVIGVGGLGHMAIQIVKALTPAKVIAVDAAEDKLVHARELGADEAVLPDRAQEAVADSSGLRGGGAELVLDFVGSEQTMSLAARCVRTLGHLTVVGLGLGTLPFNVLGLPYEASVASTYWGTLPELFEVVALTESGKIHVHVERFHLEKAQDAYDAMRAGSLRGRAVIVPNSL